MLGALKTGDGNASGLGRGPYRGRDVQLAGGGVGNVTVHAPD